MLSVKTMAEDGLLDEKVVELAKASFTEHIVVQAERQKIERKRELFARKQEEISGLREQMTVGRLNSPNVDSSSGDANDPDEDWQTMRRWLDDNRLSRHVAVFADVLGADFSIQDLEFLCTEDIEQICDRMTRIEAKRFRTLIQGVNSAQPTLSSPESNSTS
eukprot:COSAG05_NODE_6651_length_926_cov_0.807739_2_plen_162_part_00